jgi:hypothetical protein
MKKKKKTDMAVIKEEEYDHPEGIGSQLKKLQMRI